MEKDRNRFTETLKIVGAAAATGVVLYEASRWALTTSARKEAGKRDNWTCMGVDGEDCYQKTVNGEEVSFGNGYMVTLAHYKTTQFLSGKGFHDKNPENARCLCGICHATEELDMGNKWGAEKLLNMGNYTTNAVKDKEREQVYYTVEEALEIRDKAREIKIEEHREREARQTESRLSELRAALGSGGSRRI